MEEEVVRHQAEGIAHRGRAEKWQHQVGAGVHTPYAQRLAEVTKVPVQTHTGRWIKQAADAHRRVDHQPRGIAGAVFEFALQEIIDDGGRRNQVAHEIADANAHRTRRHLHIAAGRGTQDGVIEFGIEREHRAVDAFETIAWVRLAARKCGATGQPQEHCQQCKRGCAGRER